MKKVSILAAVLGLVALVIGLYHMVETYPNIEGFKNLDRALWRAYRSTGWIQIYTMWGTGGLAALLGLAGTIKGQGSTKKIAMAGLIFALCALGISFSTMMAGRI